MATVSEEPMTNSTAERLVEATVKLLAERGPSAVKAREVAAEAGMSTMVVYSHHGGIPELISAAVEHGFKQIERVFAATDVTDDPVADLFTMALATRRIARENPHLYDAMFGLSTRATYRPTQPEKASRHSGHSPSFKAAFAHITEACERLAESGRAEVASVDALAGALWSYVHGFVTLELADHFTDFDDPVAQVMVPMGVTLMIGLGDKPERARASHEAGLRRHAH